LIWLPTVRTLIDASAAVLMDLRGFVRDNMGCIFEIEELFQRAPAERLVFLIDATTDRPFLEQCMREAWTKSTGTRNRAPAGTGTVVRLWMMENAKALRRLPAGIDAISE
jgi:hypothetical protein